MIMKVRFKITRGGQVTIPASVRRRWGTSTVVAEDHGDTLVLRPAPDDPIEAAYGIFAAEFREAPRLEEIRAEEREGEADAAERRLEG